MPRKSKKTARPRVSRHAKDFAMAAIAVADPKAAAMITLVEKGQKLAKDLTKPAHTRKKRRSR